MSNIEYDKLQFRKDLISKIFVAKIDQVTHVDNSSIEDLAEYSIFCADILIKQMEDSEEIKVVPASIDYSKIPENCENKWVVVNKINHEILGHGNSPEEALNRAGVSGNDSNIVMTKINKAGGRWTIETVDKF